MKCRDCVFHRIAYDESKSGLLKYIWILCRNPELNDPFYVERNKIDPEEGCQKGSTVGEWDEKYAKIE